MKKNSQIENSDSSKKNKKNFFQNWFLNFLNITSFVSTLALIYILALIFWSSLSTPQNRLPYESIRYYKPLLEENSAEKVIFKLKSKLKKKIDQNAKICVRPPTFPTIQRIVVENGKQTRQNEQNEGPNNMLLRPIANIPRELHAIHGVWFGIKNVLRVPKQIEPAFAMIQKPSSSNQLSFFQNTIKFIKKGAQNQNSKVTITKAKQSFTIPGQILKMDITQMNSKGQIETLRQSTFVSPEIETTFDVMREFASNKIEKVSQASKQTQKKLKQTLDLFYKIIQNTEKQHEVVSVPSKQKKAELQTLNNVTESLKIGDARPLVKNAELIAWVLERASVEELIIEELSNYTEQLNQLKKKPKEVYQDFYMHNYVQNISGRVIQKTTTSLFAQEGELEKWIQMLHRAYETGNKDVFVELSVKVATENINNIYFTDAYRFFDNFYGVGNNTSTTSKKLLVKLMNKVFPKILTNYFKNTEMIQFQTELEHKVPWAYAKNSVLPESLYKMFKRFLNKSPNTTLILRAHHQNKTNLEWNTYAGTSIITRPVKNRIEGKIIESSLLKGNLSKLMENQKFVYNTQYQKTVDGNIQQVGLPIAKIVETNSNLTTNPRSQKVYDLDQQNLNDSSNLQDRQENGKVIIWTESEPIEVISNADSNTKFHKRYSSAPAVLSQYSNQIDPQKTEQELKAKITYVTNDLTVHVNDYVTLDQNGIGVQQLIDKAPLNLNSEITTTRLEIEPNGEIKVKIECFSKENYQKSQDEQTETESYQKPEDVQVEKKKNDEKSQK